MKKNFISSDFMSYDNIKSNKKRGFILTLEKFSKKHRGGGGGTGCEGVRLTSPTFLRLRIKECS